MSAGLPRIEVKFLIDADDSPQVSSSRAAAKSSADRSEADLWPHGWLGRRHDSRSFDHAEEDFAKRLLIEARNEAETILTAVEQAPENPRGSSCVAKSRHRSWLRKRKWECRV